MNIKTNLYSEERETSSLCFEDKKTYKGVGHYTTYSGAQVKFKCIFLFINNILIWIGLRGSAHTSWFSFWVLTIKVLNVTALAITLTLNFKITQTVCAIALNISAYMRTCYVCCIYIVYHNRWHSDYQIRWRYNFNRYIAELLIHFYT